MKICAVVVWYNPSKTEVENIKTYCEAVDEVIVVDNSKDNNVHMLSEIKNINYIPNFDNLGIATALNIGCKKAIYNRYEWVLTMDQDSSFKHDNINKYIDKAKRLSLKDKMIAIFAPVTSDIEGNGYIDRAITSGNLLKLEIYNSIGGFDDKLFIDEVDFDLCFRLGREGYKIYKFNDICLNHKIGDTKKVSILGRTFECMNHNYIRKYYIIRNRMYVMNKYPEYTWMYTKTNWLDVLKIILGENDKFRKLIYMLRGYIDYKKKKFGKINI